MRPSSQGHRGYGTHTIDIVPDVRFPVPVDVTDGVAVTVAVPGPIPRTSPAADTIKTLVLEDSQSTALACDGCTGFDVPSEYVSVTVSWITSPTRTVAGPVTWAVTSRPYSQPDAVRLMNNSATTDNRFGLHMAYCCTLDEIVSEGWTEDPTQPSGRRCSEAVLLRSEMDPMLRGLQSAHRPGDIFRGRARRLPCPGAPRVEGRAHRRIETKLTGLTF
jgi:hypothetical protein